MNQIWMSNHYQLTELDFLLVSSTMLMLFLMALDPSSFETVNLCHSSWIQELERLLGDFTFFAWNFGQIRNISTHWSLKSEVFVVWQNFSFQVVLYDGSWVPRPCLVFCKVYFYLFIYLSIYLCIYLFIYLCIYSIVYLFTYLFILFRFIYYYLSFNGCWFRNGTNGPFFLTNNISFWLDGFFLIKCKLK